MSDTTMDAAAKQRVKDALVRHLKGELDASQTAASTEQRTAQVDPDDSHSVDDTAQLDEAGDKNALFEQVTDTERSDVSTAEGLDMSATDVVRPGAIVGFGGDRYVVGVVTDSFDANGVSYEGISQDSPVYAEIDGKRAGDTFTINDRQARIDFLA
ncbi:hypothetical protein [Flexivirga meconopsidis]|uniref:hypothetical protein n=1 Tax=Flexivirga meconopsidis TaxID=2977121 RepID=UPI00223F40A0|nr:hypothetical protein [Flexivirga meconopsidis]